MRERSKRNPAVVEGSSGDAVLHQGRCIDGGFRILSSGSKASRAIRRLPGSEGSSMHLRGCRTFIVNGSEASPKPIPDPPDPIGRRMSSGCLRIPLRSEWAVHSPVSVGLRSILSEGRVEGESGGGRAPPGKTFVLDRPRGRREAPEATHEKDLRGPV